MTPRNAHGPQLDSVALGELRRLARSKPTSGRGQLAALGALRVIERLEREEARRKPPEPEFPWEDPTLSPEARRSLLELYLSSEVARVLLGGHLPAMTDWREGSPCTREAVAIADRILEADDPPAAFRAWRDDQRLAKCVCFDAIA